MMMQIVFLSVAHQCLHALFVIQNAFSKAEVLRSDLQKLVICQKLQALFQTQSSGRNQTKSLVAAGSTGVCKLFFLANVDGDIFLFRALTDDHSAVDRYTGADEQSTAVLSCEQTIGHAVPGLIGNQGTGIAAGDISFVRFVFFKHGSQNTLALCVGCLEKLVDDVLDRYFNPKLL